MSTRLSKGRLIVSALLGWLWLLPNGGSLRATAEEPFAVSVSFTKRVHAEPFTGRLYVFFTAQNREPRLGPNWFEPEEFLAVDVEQLPPETDFRIALSDEARVLRYPRGLQPAALKDRQIQAVARFQPWEREIGSGPGNGYSPVEKVGDPARETLKLVIDTLVPERKFSETAWSKELRVRSELLSRFHGRDVHIQAAVNLPASYASEPDRKYPAIFSIPGFGGTHYSARRNNPVLEANAEGVEFLRVTLDPNCPRGHHVFADSENNGPWGTALVTEFLPEFDRRFRSRAEPAARFLTGHSSGGWSSLWIQICHPETFGGVWSTAPDPVDFRDFQRINLYADGANMYRDEHQNRRPIARRGKEEVRLWYDDFDHMETVLGPGGQLQSFEAVFSPRDKKGSPLEAWNRRTGMVNRDVTQHWEHYDIRLQLERRWPVLKPKLAGKLHVFMGDQDTFYLEGATQLLQATLKELGSDAVVEIHPGKDHGSLLTEELRQRLRQEMTAKFLEASGRPAQ